MADSTAIAVVSVSVAGAATIAAPAITAWLEARRETRRFMRERARDDLSELREVLDACTTTVAEYAEAQTSADALFMFRTPNMDELTAKLSELTTAKRRCYGVNRQIVLRLGPAHDVTKTLGAVLRVLDEGGQRFADQVPRLVVERAAAVAAYKSRQIKREQDRLEADTVLRSTRLPPRSSAPSLRSASARSRPPGLTGRKKLPQGGGTPVIGPPAVRAGG